MTKVIKWFYWLLDFRFLPDRLQNWLFGTGTRIIEVLNGFAMLGFALVFGLHGDEIIKEDLYGKFPHLYPKVFVTILIMVAIGQLFTAFCHSSRSNIFRLLPAVVGTDLVCDIRYVYRRLSATVHRHDHLSADCHHMRTGRQESD